MVCDSLIFSLLVGILLENGRKKMSLEALKEKYHEAISERFPFDSPDQLIEFMKYQKELIKRENITDSQSKSVKITRKESRESSDSGVGYEKSTKSAQSSTNDTWSSLKQHNPRKTASNGCKRPSGYGGVTTNSSNDNTFYGYQLLCDDFVMSMAVVELDKKYTLNKRVRTLNLSYSGLTIRGAIQQLNKISNTKVILNVGSEDILNGRQLIDMQEDFRLLIRICKDRNIQLIITTLAPLANLLHNAIVVRKLQHFNRFLLGFTLSHKVIDIAPCMMTTTNKIQFTCYKSEPFYVSGSRMPHLLWNKIGRQNVLNKIKEGLVYP